MPKTQTPPESSTVKQLAQQLAESLPDTRMKPVVTEIGEVVYVGDGVVKIKGLPSARIEEVVDIDTGESITQALILGISTTLIEAVVLGEYLKIRQGNVVRSTGSVLRIQSGEQLLGRVVNPMGIPIDGRGAIRSSTYQQVERLAPGVAKRQPVVNQLETGILVVDATIPIGKGQRELIIGDRKSGKTRLIASLILNQKGRGITCIYVAVGAQKAKVRELEELLRAGGAMEYTCMVVGSSDDPPSLNYIAPYAGCAIGEYFMYGGQDALIIYDDLSKHAKAYRQMSLLLKRSPGRDAYPGDIFYLHSRLLERTARLSEDLKGGSLTGFPMAETQNGDLSEYIVTNLMSITDGHIYLDLNLMHEGIFPAVNSGASVSRIGGSVQPPCLRKVGELASTQMARYQEVKSFETLNTEISEDTEREIKRGKRILETLAQDYRFNMSNDEKILLLYIITAGKADNIEVVDVRKIKVELVEFYRKGSYPEFKEKAPVEKDIAVLEPLIMKIVQDYVAQSPVIGAKWLIGEKPAEEKPMPIVPDPSQPGAAPAEGEKKPAEGETKPEDAKTEAPKEGEAPAEEKKEETKPAEPVAEAPVAEEKKEEPAAETKPEDAKTEPPPTEESKPAEPVEEKKEEPPAVEVKPEPAPEPAAEPTPTEEAPVKKPAEEAAKPAEPAAETPATEEKKEEPKA
ncbi:MAG: F0F1 ATP synthase subunit alpha [bacterium]